MSIIRSAGLPVRRYFNQHFEMVKEEVRQASQPERWSNSVTAQWSDQVNQIVKASRETQVFIARQLGEMLGQVDEFDRRHAALADSVERLTGTATQLAEAVAQIAVAVEQIGHAVENVRTDLPSLLTPSIPECLADVGSRDSALLDKMNTHDGFLAQAGVWVNNPVSSGFGEDGLTLQDVNERIGELPFVFSKIGTLQPPARILDVGSCESTVALSLATLGYEATALDPRPYSFQHPRLTVVTSGVEDLPVDDQFDAVVLLSTIEHLGLGSYGLQKGNRQDLVAMRHIRELLRPGGLLVLTTPFGRPKVDDLERTYDLAGVHELIEGFVVDDEPTVLVRRSRREWEYEEHGFAEVTDDHQRVVMLTAHRPDQ